MGYLTLSKAAEYLGVSLRHFSRHVQPTVPRVKIGRRVFYRPEDLDAYATECTVIPAGASRRVRSAVLAKARALPPLSVRGAS